MKTESLPPGQNPAEIGAGGLPVLGSGSEAGAAALERLRQTGMVDESNPAEKGGGGEGYTEDEMRQIRQWRKEQILSGAANLDVEIRAIKDRVRRGEILSKPETFRLRDGSTVEATLGDRLRGLLLARMIWYPTAKEAALALRENEGIVRQEIDEYQVFEGGVGASSQPLATGLNKVGGVPYTEGDYFVKLSETQKLVENPPELQEFRKTLETLGKEYGNEYLRRMAQRFRRHELVGLMPETKDLPPFVPFEKALKELRRLAPEGDGRSLVDEIKAMEEMAEEERMRQAKELGLGMARQEIGGEYYIGMYQEAWDEFCEALITFPPEVQDEIIANYIIGGSMMGGQYPAFYRKGVEQRGRFPSKWTPWLNAIEHFQKTEQTDGYFAMEQIFQMLGSTKPEVLSFPNFHSSRHEIWLAGENEPRTFSISSRELIGELGKLDVLARLGVTNAFRNKTGFLAVRNGEFAAYLFRKMGFNPELARKMAFDEAELPVLIRDSRLSPVRRREITDIGDWIGETAIDKLVVAMAWIKWAREDFEHVPLDVGRRAILSGRGVELAAYKHRYGIGLPPEQLLSMVATFPSATSIDFESMLAWVTQRMGINFSERVATSQEKQGGAENAKIRNAVWDETIRLKRPSLASIRHLARMAKGIGKYNLAGDEYRKQLRKGMVVLPKMNIDALRHPDLWKWRWYENADADPTQWRYVGHICDPRLTEERLREVFAGYDFTEELNKCGLSDTQLFSIPKIGYEGWKRLLQHATKGLIDWEAASYTLGDKVWRYQQKKDKTRDEIMKFFEISVGAVPDSLDDAVNILPEVGQTGDLPGDRVGSFEPERGAIGPRKDEILIERQSLKEPLAKGLPEIISALSHAVAYIPNDAQSSVAESMWSMYLEGHCAHKLETYIEDINLGSLEGGVNYSTPLLTIADIDPRRIPALLSEGFYFQTMPDVPDKPRVLVSPLASPLPQLVKAGDLLQKLETVANNLIVSRDPLADRAQHLRDAVQFMRRKKAFCWETLVNGKKDMPPMILAEAIRDIKEEGTITAAARRAMTNETLRFMSKVSPYGVINLRGKADKPEEFDSFVPRLSD